jgi:hypothetical protein
VGEGARATPCAILSPLPAWAWRRRCPSTSHASDARRCCSSRAYPVRDRSSTSPRPLKRPPADPTREFKSTGSVTVSVFPGRVQNRNQINVRRGIALTNHRRACGGNRSQTRPSTDPTPAPCDNVRAGYTATRDFLGQPLIWALDREFDSPTPIDGRKIKYHWVCPTRGRRPPPRGTKWSFWQFYKCIAGQGFPLHD